MHVLLSYNIMRCCLQRRDVVLAALYYWQGKPWVSRRELGGRVGTRAEDKDKSTQVSG